LIFVSLGPFMFVSFFGAARTVLAGWWTCRRRRRHSARHVAYSLGVSPRLAAQSVAALHELTAWDLGFVGDVDRWLGGCSHYHWKVDGIVRPDVMLMGGSDGRTGSLACQYL